MVKYTENCSCGDCKEEKCNCATNCGCGCHGKCSCGDCENNSCQCGENCGCNCH